MDCDGYGYWWEGLKNKSYHRGSHCTCTKLSENKLSEGSIIAQHQDSIDGVIISYPTSEPIENNSAREAWTFKKKKLL